MAKKMQCERCKKEFVCMHNDISSCQCDGISLSQALRDKLAEDYSDCLCRACLIELNDKFLPE